MPPRKNLVTADYIAGVQPNPDSDEPVPEEALTPPELADDDGPVEVVAARVQSAPQTRETGLCTVRITKAGDRLVHDGNEGRYRWEDKVKLPRGVGLALEAKHYGEILD